MQCFMRGYSRCVLLGMGCPDLDDLPQSTLLCKMALQLWQRSWKEHPPPLCSHIICIIAWGFDPLMNTSFRFAKIRLDNTSSNNNYTTTKHFFTFTYGPSYDAPRKLTSGIGNEWLHFLSARDAWRIVIQAVSWQYGKTYGSITIS